jgi:hypothetical protein
VIDANGITFLLAAGVVVAKLRFRR